MDILHHLFISPSLLGIFFAFLLATGACVFEIVSIGRCNYPLKE